MNRWPGERSGALNPLRLNKKLWIEAQQSKRYSNTKKEFVLSQYEEKNSQEIVSNLSQVPESVGTVNCLLPSSA